MRHLPVRAVLSSGAAVLLIGCADAGGSDVGYAVRDSAGVEIVELTGPAWDEGEGWTVAPEPMLHIGVVDGPPEYQLDRIADAVRLSDGRVAVANGGTQEIRLFAAGGGFERAIGREGGGPGEFRGLNWLRALPGDSLLAYDWRERRATLFTAAGDLVASTAIRPDSGGGPPPRAVGRLRDGSMVAQIATMPPIGEMRTMLMRSPARFTRFSADGAPLNDIVELAGEERMLRVDQASRSVSIMVLPIFRSSRAAVAGSHIYAGDTDRYEIRRYDAAGALGRIIRFRRQPVSVTAADAEAVAASRMAQAETPEQRRIAAGFADDIDMPETMPAFSDLRTDDPGNVWIQEFVWPDGGGRVWNVLGPDGRWLGDVEMPENLRPTHIGADFVVGVWRDELDVEHVRVHALEKS